MRLILGLLVPVAVAVGFYLALTRSEPPGRAARPTTDWVSGEPAEEGFEPTRFERAVRRVEREEPSMLALLVTRNGKLVHEGYYHGHRRDDDVEAYSITKTVTSALVGIAIGEGKIPGVNTPISRLLGSQVPKRARGITIHHLLTMTAGWPGDGDVRNVGGPRPNLVRALLRRPVIRRPGSKFVYDTGSSHLLSALITRATGMSAEAYARRHLLGPLGIRLADYWPKDRQGTTYGGTGLALVARDAAKLGQLYVQRGRWRSRQLVPRSWVERSFREHVKLGAGRGYGYDWWTERRDGISMFVALGFGGQAVAVIPKAGVVVTVFSSTAGDPVRLSKVVFDRILPSLRGRAAA